MNQKIAKRALDVAISAAASPFVAAACLALGAAIKAEDNGPVFYNAPRMGLNGREFTMFKLRSMHVNSPDLKMADGSTYNAPDDPRMTKIGAFMRRTSLDELPQFFNVLIGDMSVVGPRPDLREEAELYEGDEWRKLTVKPGITGYAQVYGRNSIPWKERLKLDLYYVDHQSLALDARIFFKTISSVLKQDGVFNKAEDEGADEEAATAQAAQAPQDPKRKGARRCVTVDALCCTERAADGR